MQAMKRLSSILRDRSSILAGLLLMALALHFGATVVYLMPLNPLKLHFQRSLQKYIDPYFSQRWELFAPNPVVDSRRFLVSCRLHAPDGTDADSAWADITTPVQQLR